MTPLVKRKRISIFNIPLILSAIVFSIWPITAAANGAAGWPGVWGNELTISETKPFSKFIVDEEVLIDGNNNKIKVKYSINNTSSTVQAFTMVFPIEEDCKSAISRYATDEISLIEFHAKLNGSDISVEQVDPINIKLNGEYSAIASNSTCSLLTFKLRILPGNNMLDITYNLIAAGFAGDGLGNDWSYVYSIWPAKNWVPKFRHALWRIILPKRNYVHRKDNWYTGYSGKSWAWYENDLSIIAPGTRSDFSDHIDFTADNYVPAGQISIKSSMRLLYSLIHSCEDDPDKNCEQESLKSLLEIRPYTGNERCYDLNDVKTSAAYMGFTFDPNAIPILRNEIFARKGFIFKTPSMKQFFSRMPWYKPTAESVQLNDIEKWNIAFLKSIETSVKSYEDAAKLSALYRNLKTTCPGSSYDREMSER